MYKIVLFDLDGTLTNPELGITNSINYALNKYNMEIKDRSIILKFIGPPLVDSFQEFLGFSKEKSLEAIDYYRQYYKNNGIIENEVYENVEFTLKKLKENGHILAVATSKPEKFAIDILEHFNLSKYFDVISGATLDGSISTKDEVIKNTLSKLSIKDLKKVIMVGDRKFDILGANKFNISSIGVLYGFGSYQELKEAKATYIVKDIKDIIEIVK